MVSKIALPVKVTKFAISSKNSGSSSFKKKNKFLFHQKKFFLLQKYFAKLGINPVMRLKKFFEGGLASL
jgi:hypothetical protein